MIQIEPLYTAYATATGGRNGHVQTSDRLLDLQVRIPQTMGGPGGTYTNPEQLFAAGYAACFDGALQLAIRQNKSKAGITKVTAAVSIGDNGSGGFGLAVVLKAVVPGVTLEEAQKLVAEAHTICPYSNATRGNVSVTLDVTAV